MINLTLSSTAPAPQASPIAAANLARVDGAPAAPQDTGATLPYAAQLFAATPFADLLGQLDESGAVDASTDPVVADGSDVEPAPDAGDGQGNSDAGQPPALTAAMTMAMPLLPAALAAASAVAAAVAAATATGPRIGSDGGEARAESGAAIATAINAGPNPAAVAAALPPADAGQAIPTPPQARPTADATADTQASTAAYRATPVAAPTAADGASDLAAKTDAAVPRDGAGVPGAAPAPAAAPAGTDTVALSGPPTAWRQSLREALGERLQMQAGHGLEQAVIRLDPPQLGRVEIAIRHSAGSLEVTLSATHGEVLRQLHGVSDSLRSDLAQRQYVEVAVTVTPAPRNAAANPFGGDAQGRGRQGGREQEQQTPGLALLDDGPAASGFSLTGRD
jgi:flagellar hook-length control protein FliK